MAVESSIWNIVSLIAKELISRLFNKRKPRLSEKKIVAKRAHYRSEIAPKLWKATQEDQFFDIIIRDIDRLKEYPDIPQTRGITSWLRVGLSGTYQDGIWIGLQWSGIFFDDEFQQWVCPDYQHPDWERTSKALIAGKLPFEWIEQIDWDGDQYYNRPIFFVRYWGRNRAPYESVHFCEVVDSGEGINRIRFLREIIEARKVRDQSFIEVARAFGHIERTKFDGATRDGIDVDDH